MSKPKSRTLRGVLSQSIQQAESDAVRAGKVAARAEKLGSLDDQAKAFRERILRNRAEHEASSDTEVWVAVVFSSRAEKDAFIAEFGLINHPLIPGTPGNKYVDGVALGDSLRKRVAR